MSALPTGVELLEPQLTFRCVHCGEAPGESEWGGYLTYHPVSDPAKAIDEAGWHVIHGSVVCDNCAYEHHRNCKDELHSEGEQHADERTPGRRLWDRIEGSKVSDGSAYFDLANPALKAAHERVGSEVDAIEARAVVAEEACAIHQEARGEVERELVAAEAERDALKEALVRVRSLLPHIAYGKRAMKVGNQAHDLITAALAASVSKEEARDDA